jgi:hypothetical protein
MKKPKIGDRAFCCGHTKIYGVFDVLHVLKEKSILGYKCRGNYYDYKTGDNVKQERFVRWSSSRGEFRT